MEAKFLFFEVRMSSLLETRCHVWNSRTPQLMSVSGIWIYSHYSEVFYSPSPYFGGVVEMFIEIVNSTTFNHLAV